jgi:hypothetical protein
VAHDGGGRADGACLDVAQAAGPGDRVVLDLVGAAAQQIGDRVALRPTAGAVGDLDGGGGSVQTETKLGRPAS